MATWNSRGLRGSVLEEFVNRTNEKYLENYDYPDEWIEESEIIDNWIFENEISIYRFLKELVLENEACFLI